MDNSILCYISGDHGSDSDEPSQWIAFFTTRSLADQWGDDWNDAPYDCNAGWPYLPHKSYSAYDREKKEWREGSDYENGEPKWRIYMVKFTSSEYLLPCAYGVRQHYDGYGYLAVDQINDGESAWLWPSGHSYMGAIRTLLAGGRIEPEPIFAGETLKSFCDKIAKVGKVVSVEEYRRED